jgi:hypothetical protein
VRRWGRSQLFSRDRTARPCLFFSPLLLRTGVCKNGLVAWFNVTIGHDKRDVGIDLARTTENDQYAGPIRISRLIIGNIVRVPFDLDWPRTNLGPRDKSIRASLYGWFLATLRSKFLNR